ncbi:MAG: guanylate kinase [Bacteroidetes bacterium]|nr:guanylate kinase [Bacteroidota bacterium]
MEKAIIITAPSGAGKSTIAAHILESIDKLGFSVSATTRSPREGEQDGVDYYYLSKSGFMEKIDNDEFVEWEEVYEGIFYGTLKSEIERIWEKGMAVLYIVDVVGAKDLKGYFGAKALSIFIEPPSLEILKERLVKRGSETAASLEKRLERADKEMAEKENFDLSIVNDDLEIAKVQAEDEVCYFLGK